MCICMQTAKAEVLTKTLQTKTISRRVWFNLEPDSKMLLVRLIWLVLAT